MFILISRCLKVVYDEWIGYYAWMWKIQEQIDTIQDESRKVSLPFLFSSYRNLQLRFINHVLTQLRP